MSTSSAPPPINRRLGFGGPRARCVRAQRIGRLRGHGGQAIPEERSPGAASEIRAGRCCLKTWSRLRAASVQVGDGWFQKVALTNSSGKVVAGAFNQDRTVYTITEPLGYDGTYTWAGSAVGHDGKAISVTGKFTTVSPTKKIGGGFQLADGQTVGVAAPIIIQFDAPISDKASVEKALTVTTSPPVEGSWAWLPDEAQGARVHWRPREYYPAGTTVNVDAKLYGLPFGEGAYGDQDLSLRFAIGRRQVVTAEVSSHRIQVLRDEGVIMDFPCSGYGEADKARNVTRNGIHVVTEKYFPTSTCPTRPPATATLTNDGRCGSPTTASSSTPTRRARARRATPTSPTAASTCPPVRTPSSTTPPRSTVTPVEVTFGSSIQLSYSDGDIWDWAVDWDTWVAMSALPPADGASARVADPASPHQSRRRDAPTLSGTPTTTTTTTTSRPGG